MIKTVEAVIDEQGRVRLLERVAVARSQRAPATILEEEPARDLHKIARLSESALAEDRPEEEAAWSHLTAGAVILVRFPFSDLSQSKRRPALGPAVPDLGWSMAYM